MLGYLARGSSVKTPEHHDLLPRVGQASYAAVYYLLRTMLPLGLHAHHPLPPQLTLSAPLFLAALLAVILVSAGVIACARRWPGMPSVWFSYLAILAPSSGLIGFGNQLVADRYSYLPSLIWSIAAAYCLARLIGTHRRLVLGLSLALLVSLSSLSWCLCLTWRDSISLWTNVLAWDDTSYAAHLNLGSLLASKGQQSAALRHYQAAARHQSVTGPLFQLGSPPGPARTAGRGPQIPGRGTPARPPLP